MNQIRVNERNVERNLGKKSKRERNTENFVNNYKTSKMSFRRWKGTAIVFGLIGFTGVMLYPIAISPMIDATEYKKIQKEARKNIDQAKIQPGNMNVWTDPFDRKKTEHD